MKRTPQEIRDAVLQDRVEGGMTLVQLMSKYGLTKSTTFGIIQGTTRMPRRPIEKMAVSVRPVERPQLSTTDLGESARQMICARMMFAGLKVFRPMTEDTPVDLLVLRQDHSVAKCQCKYLFPDECGRHILKCSSSGKGKDRRTGRHVYRANEIDFFLGYCLDNDSVYIVPRSETGDRIILHLWILRNPVGRCQHEVVDAEKFKNAFDLLR